MYDAKRRSRRRLLWFTGALVALFLIAAGVRMRRGAKVDGQPGAAAEDGQDALRLSNLLTVMKWVDENPSLHGVAVRVIGDDHRLTDREVNALWAMAKSDDYELARAAVHCLARRYYDVDYLRLMKSFWRLCLMASERDYFADEVLPDVYREVGHNTEDALISFVEAAMGGKIAEIGMEGALWMRKRFGGPGEGADLHRLLDGDDVTDLPSYEMPQSWGSARQSALDQAIRHLYEEGLGDTEQAQRYIDSFAIFEVLTHLSFLAETKMPPSGIYRRHEPKVLNMHMVLYRALHGSLTLPGFYRGREWEMFVADEAGYRKIWEGLFNEDPRLKEAGYSAEGLLFEMNNRTLLEE